MHRPTIASMICLSHGFGTVQGCNKFTFITRTWLIRYVRVFSIAVCLSSVTFVRPTQEVESFGSIFSPLCTLAVLWLPCKILRRSSQGNLSVGGVKHKRGSKIDRCHVRASHLLMSFLSHNLCTFSLHWTPHPQRQPLSCDREKNAIVQS